MDPKDLAPEIATTIRQFLSVAGAVGSTWATTVSASKIEFFAGAASIVISWGWGVWQKRKAKAALAAAQASAYTSALPPKLPA